MKDILAVLLGLLFCLGASAQVPVYPKEGEIFKLTLDGDAPENQPLEMLRRYGTDSSDWKHNGEKVSGKQTRRFKLVRVGYCRNLDEVRKKLKGHGNIPEGQWVMAFRVAYPRSDGQGPHIGVADASWVDPDGSAYFPYVYSGGSLGFNWADIERGDHWRWLVAVSK